MPTYKRSRFPVSAKDCSPKEPKAVCCPSSMHGHDVQIVHLVPIWIINMGCMPHRACTVHTVKYDVSVYIPHVHLHVWPLWINDCMVSAMMTSHFCILSCVREGEVVCVCVFVCPGMENDHLTSDYRYYTFYTGIICLENDALVYMRTTW
jgi:hypothetical protein